MLCSSRRCVNWGVYKEKAGETGLVFLTSKCKINSNDVLVQLLMRIHHAEPKKAATSDGASLHTSLHD